MRFVYPLPGAKDAIHDNVATKVRARVTGGVLTVDDLPRPSYVALELADVFPIPDRDAFLAAFAAANRGAIRPAGAIALDPARGEAWWRYTVNKPALRLAWPTIAVSILDLHIWLRRESGDTICVLVWPPRTPAIVLPTAAEAIILMPEGTVIERHAVLEIMGGRAQPHAAPVAHWLYRGGDTHADVLAELRARGGSAQGLAPADPAKLVDPEP
jgi:hypothetical protein